MRASLLSQLHSCEEVDGLPRRRDKNYFERQGLNKLDLHILLSPIKVQTAVDHGLIGAAGPPRSLGVASVATNRLWTGLDSCHIYWADRKELCNCTPR
jgi:hypothetical protein